MSVIPIRMPLLSGELVAGLLEKMFRLHLKGKWDDPAEKLINKEPLKDIAMGTINFLKESTAAGGQLGGDVLKLFSEMSKGINGSTTQPKD